MTITVPEGMDPFIWHCARRIAQIREDLKDKSRDYKWRLSDDHMCARREQMLIDKANRLIAFNQC